MSTDAYDVTILRVRSDLKAGNIMCYQDQGGFLVPINAPCSPVNGYTPPAPPTYPDSGPWLSCNACTGTNVSSGRLQDATCEVCTM